MKKFVHSRWKGCFTTTFQEDARSTNFLGGKICRERSRRFSSPTELFRQQHTSSLEEDGSPANSNVRALTEGICSRETPIGSEDDKSSIFRRPSSTYGELIRDVYVSEGQTVMRRCDIIRHLKTRYPYFNTLRRLDSCVGLALHKHKIFQRISPGTWRIIPQRQDEMSSIGIRKGRKDGSEQTQKGGTEGDRGRSRRYQLVSSRLQRRRKRPDFLRIEWNKTNKFASTKTSIKTKNAELKVLRHQKQSAELETSDSSDGSSSDSEVRSDTSPSLPMSVDAKTQSEERALKEVLKQYNEGILKEAMEKVARENERYLQRMIATLAGIRAQQNHSIGRGNFQTEKILDEDLKRHNRKVLEGVINEIISQNQKCLDKLSAESVAFNEKRRSRKLPISSSDKAPVTNSFILDSCKVHPTLLGSQEKQMSQIIYKSQFIPVVVSRAPSQTGKVEVTPSGGLNYPLPVLNRPETHRQRNHIRLGKRVFPRLKPVEKDGMLTKREANCDENGPPSKKSLSAPISTSNKQFSGIAGPTSGSSVRKLFTAGHSKELPSAPAMRSAVESQSSLDTAFAQFALNNTELDDIVALIDPSMATGCRNRPEYAQKGFHGRRDFDQTVVEREVQAKQGDVTTVSNLAAPQCSNHHSSTGNSEEIVTNQPSAGTVPAAEIAEKTPSMPKINSVCSKAKETKSDKTLQLAASGFVKLSPKKIARQSVEKRDVSVRLSDINLWKSRVEKASAEPVASYAGVDGKPLNYRYVPPYRWGVHNDVSPSNRILRPPQSLVLTPRYVMYSPVRSGFTRFTPPVGTFINGGNNSHTMHRVGLEKPDVRCRIRGAHVFRFPVRK